MVDSGLVKAWLAKRGLNTQWLATELHYNYTHLISILAGRRNMHLKRLIKLADLMDVSLDALIGRKR